MRNLWDVVHKLVDGEPLSDAEKMLAHGLVDTHLAQHVGIAGQLGEHREHIRELRGQAGLTDAAAGMLGRAAAAGEAFSPPAPVAAPAPAPKTPDE